MSTTKETILGEVEGLVTDFLFYNRKEDEDLPLGKIEEAIRNSEITADEIVARFRESLNVGLKG